MDNATPFGAVETEDNWPAEEAPMSTTSNAVVTHTEAPVSICDKINGVLVTLRFNSIEEAEKGVSEYLTGKLRGLVRQLAPDTTRTMPSASAAPASSGAWGATPKPVEQWTTDRACEHGTLQFQSWGQNQYGNPFEGFQCPASVASRGKEGCKQPNGRPMVLWLSQAKKEGAARKA